MSDAERTDPVSWWSLACAFLERFAASDSSSPLAHLDARYDAWMDMAGRVGDLLAERDEHEPAPWPGLSQALEQLVASAAEPVDAAHAVASILDDRFAQTFPDDWTAAGDAAQFDLADGDLYPVLETPWRIFHPYLSRPASMTDPRRNELAHVRRFDASLLHPDKVTGVRVHRLTGLLRDVLTSLSSIATAHPNIDRDEIRWPDGRQLWPVTIRDPVRQVEVVTQLVSAALAGGSRLIVLPELSATGDTIAAVRALIDAHYDEEEPAIVLAGTRHLDLGDGQRRNRATTLIAGVPVELQHDKLIPYRNGDAIEDLHGDGTLHLYQDGQFRLAAAVCKDLLDSDIEQVLERLGVNVLLVPAMSIKTPNFPLAVARLLHTAQTLTVVANCPLVDDDGRSLPHCSLTARPTAKGLPVLFWPAGGAHAPRPQAPLWVEHPLTSGATARDHPLSGPKCH